MNHFFVCCCFVLMTILLLPGISCKDKDDDTLDCMAFEWGYHGDTGPEFWGLCIPGCNGHSQSPVNITAYQNDIALEEPEFNYQASSIDLINTGETVKFNYSSGSELDWGGNTYELLQFHFHTRSEHLIDGEPYAMEIHLVHRKAADELAVVGIMVEEGEENELLGMLASVLPQEANQVYVSINTINVYELIPENRSYFTYQGSLTTPGCDEIVTWMVMKTPISASPTQILHFSSLLYHNYRPVQEIEGREIRLFNN